jgi:Conjugative transposon protein TcpC
MVRGPEPSDGRHSSVYYLAPPVPDPAGHRGAHSGSAMPRPPLPRDPRPGRQWNWVGGRWLLWSLRGVLWLALLVIAYRGVMAIALGQASATSGGATPAAGIAAARFPATLAEAYAMEFGQAYLNFSPATAAEREQELAGFVPASVTAADPDLGWNGTGKMRLQSEQVAGIAVRDPQHAVVTLLATVNGQLMELGVPVAASGQGVVVTGQPAWLPAPQQISPPAAAARSSDPAAKSELMNELPAFFQAYAQGDSAALNRFAAPGVSLAGLDGAVTFDSIAGLAVPAGGRTRQITVTVIWDLPGSAPPNVTKLEMTYGMSVVDLQSGKWYVNEISASTEAVGAE